MLRNVQRLLLLLGIAVCVFLVAQVGTDQIQRDLERMGWSLLAVVLIELTIDVINTVGWRLTFAPEDRRVPFGQLFLARMAGTAFNQILPAATIGGEPVKAMLLKTHLPYSSTLASLVTAKLTYSLAQAVFALGGVLVAFHVFALPEALRRGLLASLAVTISGIGLFVWVQRRGLFATVTALSRKLGMPDSWGRTVEHATSALDGRVRRFHVERPLDFLLSVACHLTSPMLGVLQVFLLLHWLDIPAGFLTCFTIEALAILIQAAAFLVPGSIGVQEGGKMVIFSALGLPASAGFSVGIAFRLNQVVGIVLGLLAYALLHWQQGSASQAGVTSLASTPGGPAGGEPGTSAPTP